MDNPIFTPEQGTDQDGLVRLQKLLAHRGLSSRRNAEEMIRGGLVRVNGTIVTVPGTKVHPEHDRVTVDGKAVPVEAEPFLFLFYKPKGVVSTLHDPDGKTTLKEFFPQINPLIHVGRLDIQSEGVLLLTNNGDLAQRILHPRYEIPRTYLVKVQGVVTPEHLDRLRSGKIRLDGRPVLPLELEQERLTETNSWYRITLTEGRNREVRRLFDALHYFVLKLTRIAFGNLDLSGLEPGEYRLVTSEEIGLLLTGTRWKKKEPSAPPTRASRRENPSPPALSDRAHRSFRSPDSSSGRSIPAKHHEEESAEGNFLKGKRPQRAFRPNDRFRDDSGRPGGRKFSRERPQRSPSEKPAGPSFRRERFQPSEDRNNSPRKGAFDSTETRSHGRPSRPHTNSSFRGDRSRSFQNSGQKPRSGSFRREEERPSAPPSSGRDNRRDFREDRSRSFQDSGQKPRPGSFRREEERPSAPPSSGRDNRRDFREDRSREQGMQESKFFRKDRQEFDKPSHSSASRGPSGKRSGKPPSGPRGRKGPGKNHPHHS